MGQRLTFGETQTAVILTMYEALASDVSEAVTELQLEAIFRKDDVSKNFLRRAMQQLYSEEYVYFVKADETNTDWRLSSQGIENAESILAYGTTLVEMVPNYDLSIFQDTNQSTAVLTHGGHLVEAEPWEPLPLDRGSDEFKEALRSTEEAEKIIREDNGFSTTHHEVRDNIVWSLGSTVNQLREGLITSAQIQSMLITPLRKVTELFAEGAMKVAAQRAVEKLTALLSSMI